MRATAQKSAAGRKQGGFSLIEIMMVIFIILVIAAYAVPNISYAIANIELRSAAASVAGIVQQTRIVAAKRNQTIGAKMDTLSNGAIIRAYVDISGDGALGNYTSNGITYQEPVAELSRNVYLASDTDTSIPTFNSTSLLGYNQAYTVTGTTPTFTIYFNARGLPCTMQSGVCTTMANVTSGGNTFKTTSAGYLYFFYRQGISKTWAALSITPAGRVRVWSYEGKWN